MTRRATKKLLHRANQAFTDERYTEAERIYRELTTKFDYVAPSLLDYTACVFGLIRTLYASDRDDEARALADCACEELSSERRHLKLAA